MRRDDRSIENGKDWKPRFLDGKPPDVSVDSVVAVIGVVAERCLELTGADGTIIEFAEGDEMVYRAFSWTTAGRRGVVS